jgi:hypothetical protein
MREAEPPASRGYGWQGYVLQLSLRYECLRPSSCKFEMQSRKSAIDFFARSRIFRSSEISCSGPARIIMISTYPLMAVRSSTSLRAISLARRNSFTSSFRNASHLWSRLPCSVTSNLPLSKFNLILPVTLDPYFSFRIGTRIVSRDVEGHYLTAGSKSFLPPWLQGRNKGGEPARSPPRERRNPPQEFGALGDHEKLSYLRACDQAVTEFACFTRVGAWKNASAVSTEIRPAPKISTISETMRKAKGAAAINLSGSEKKESSASRSPIT